MDIEDRLRYVRNLDLPPAEEQTSAATKLRFTDGGEAGYVDAAELLGFASGLSEQAHSDVLNSMLLAQLAANKAVPNREADTAAWYKKYREVLENVGWAISSFQFSHVKIHGETFQIKSEVINILKGLASANALGAVKATLAVVEALGSGDDRVKLFSQSSSNSSSGSFQVGAVSEHNGNPSMSLGAIHFTATEVRTDFLWWNYSNSSVQLYQSAQNVSLSEDVYKQVRKAIVIKLGREADKYIANLDI
jgi:hypothetical protein